MKKPIVIIINGNGGCGKDTFIEYCKQYSAYNIKNVSTVDLIKNAAQILGWNGEKDEKSRKFLSDLKDLSSEAFDTPFKYIKDQIQYAYNNKIEYVFVHSREPEEIARFVKEFNAYTLFIDASKRKSTIITNHADANVANYNYDFYIDNNGTEEEFALRAKQFIEYYDKEIKNGTFN